jgi:beta-glucanase (GH16 family)
MKYPPLFRVLAISLLGLSLLGGCDETEILTDHPCDFSTNLDDYTQVWNDEFDSEINEAFWSFETGDGFDPVCGRPAGWGNNELQWYTDEAKNAFVEDGNLVIRAVRETQPVNGYDYTSARLISKDKVDIKFGRIDIRAKLPQGQGLWPAIWMLSTEEKYGCWPASGEIDIMELIGNKPREVLGTVHYGHDFWRFKSAYFTKESGEPNFAEEFHTFSLYWREDCLRFAVDGEFYGDPITPSVTLPTGYPFNEEFYLILNIAVGGNLPGNPDASTVFPQDMEIDYIRVYEEN